MKIPKKLKIAGVNYTVELRKNLYIKEGLAGKHEENQCKIVIYIKEGLAGKHEENQYGIVIQSNEYNPQKIEQIFFHELLHAIDCNYNNYSLDEKTIDGLANGLHQVLKDNHLLK